MLAPSTEADVLLERLVSACAKHTAVAIPAASNNPIHFNNPTHLMFITVSPVLFIILFIALSPESTPTSRAVSIYIRGEKAPRSLANFCA
jgi:hypothetical protein